MQFRINNQSDIYFLFFNNISIAAANFEFSTIRMPAVIPAAKWYFIWTYHTFFF